MIERIWSWNKNKREILPWVKDFTDPLDEIRYSNNVRDMPFDKWFYCHPTAYQLIYYGTFGSAMLICLILMGICWFFGWIGPMLIPFIIFIISSYQLLKRIKHRNMVKDLTLYDLYMREYK